MENNFEGLKVFSVTEIKAENGSGVLDSGGIFNTVSMMQLLEGVPKSRTSDKAYIKFGIDNQHPQYLLELFKKSGTHQSIVRTKAILTMGDGIVLEGPDAEKGYELLDSLNYMDDIHEPIAWDVTMYGGFVVQKIYGETDLELNRQKLTLLHHHPFYEFRIGPPEKVQIGINIPLLGLIHSNWSKGTRKSDIIELPLYFDEDNPLKKEKPIQDLLSEYESDNQLYYGKIYSPSTRFYPVPDYQSESGMNAIMLDNELILFDISELTNNMTAGYMITFIRKDYSTEDPEKENRFRKAEESLVKNDMRGAGNNKRIVITRAEPPKPGEEVRQPFQLQEIPSTNTGDRHNIIERRKNIAILVAHGLAAPEIAGIPDLNKGSFTSQAENLLQSVELLFEFRIKSLRKPLLKFVMSLMDEAGLDITSAQVKDNIPFRKKISDAMWKHAFLIDEIRNAYGHAALSEEEREKLNEEKSKAVAEPLVGPMGQTALNFGEE